MLWGLVSGSYCIMISWDVGTQMYPSHTFFFIQYLEALMVGPVNMLPELVNKTCPRVLLNRELVGTFLSNNGPKTRRKSYERKQRDIFHPGDCDESIRTLCAILGWESDLDELNTSTKLG